MQSQHVGKRVQVEHERLRELLLVLERMAREVVNGERHLLGGLRIEAERLETELDEHMRWEDDSLRHALLEADPSAGSAVEQIFEDHRIQRETLCAALEAVESQSRPPVVIARSLLDLTRTLRTEMDHEEQLLVRGEPARPPFPPAADNGAGRL